MDKSVACWIMEFILRQQIDERTINTLLTVLPLPPNHYPLTKSLLLRRILSETTSNSVSENILDLLEITAELDHLAALPPSPSMQRAYCRVALACTAQAEGAEYFEAVKRVWRGRVGKMGECGLVSEELMGWTEEVEAAVWNEGVRERVRREGGAVGAVREYVTEAWEGLGMTFLDELAGLVEVGDEVVRQVLGVVGDDGYEATMNDDTTREVLGVEDNRVPHQQPIVNNVNDASQNSTRMPRRKHVAKKRYRGSVAGTSRGAKITDTEQVDNGESSSDRYGSLPSPAINKLQEALKSSSLELHAAVTDPLPEALKLAENAISTKNKDSRAPEDLANEADPKKPTTSFENNVPKPNLMMRNTSARTYEWDDSIDDSTEGDTGSGSRIILPSPKNRVVSPLPKPQMRKTTGRRKIKKWSMLEEKTLRTGVEKYGQGCWKTILNSYRDIFEDRTDTDLKDKWRNMTRYPR